MAALLAVIAGTLAERSTAAPSAHEGLSGVKFKVRYEGTFDATWHDSSPVQLPDPQHTFRCSGGDSSGTLTSSVHSNRKAFIFSLGYEPGGSWLSPGFRPANGIELATVTSNRTAQGWFMRYSGHQCVRYDIPQPGCAEHTFQGGVVPINSSSGRLAQAPNPFTTSTSTGSWSRSSRSAAATTSSTRGISVTAGRTPCSARSRSTAAGCASRGAAS